METLPNQPATTSPAPSRCTFASTRKCSVCFCFDACPIPCLTQRTCRCGRLLDSLGHHRAACSTVGVLGRSGVGVGVCCSTRLPRGWRSRHSQRVPQRLGYRGPNADAADNRRFEIVADGFPLFHGAQHAIDTTIVSPLRMDGVPHPRAQTWMAPLCWLLGAESNVGTPSWQVILVGPLACEVGGRW